jgi:DASH complex subunit DAD2
MAYAPRSTGIPSHIRPSSGLANPSSSNASTQSSILQARIAEKKAELENLKQLRDLSAGLADQMQQLEAKLSTLSNGTEAVAEVLGNWSHVLRAIHMASGKMYPAIEMFGWNILGLRCSVLMYV